MGDADRDDRSASETQEVVDEPILAGIPEWVIPLGAGCLLASTLLVLGATAFTAYSLANGRYYGYAGWELGLATFQFSLATVLQAVGVYFARKRVRWMIVMLAAIIGTLTIIAIPFTLVAIVCLGLGKYHFTQATPVEWLESSG